MTISVVAAFLLPVAFVWLGLFTWRHTQRKGPYDISIPVTTIVLTVMSVAVFYSTAERLGVQVDWMPVVVWAILIGVPLLAQWYSCHHNKTI